MSDPVATKEHIRGQLRVMLQKVPASIASAGIEKTRAFTRFHVKASASVKTGRGTINDWQTLISQAREIYA